MDGDRLAGFTPKTTVNGYLYIACLAACVEPGKKFPDLQLQVAGGDSAVESAGQALRASLSPALRSAAMSLAEQAAEEVRAQLPEYTVDLVISEGEPSIAVRSSEASRSFSGEDLAARLTVRLPDILKAELEEAAGDTGDSVNTYVIKTLSSKAGRKHRSKRRVTETFET